MADKFMMYIPKNYQQNYPFCRLQLVNRFDTQLNKPSNQNSLKVPKVVEPANNKIIKLWGLV